MSNIVPTGTQLHGDADASTLMRNDRSNTMNRLVLAATDPARALGAALAALFQAKGPNPVKVSRSTSQALSAGAATVIIFDAEDFDADDWHSQTANQSRLTVPAGKAGKYLIVAAADVAAGASNQSMSIQVRKNGGVVLEQVLVSGAPHIAFAVTTAQQLAVGDYLELAVFSGDARATSTAVFPPSLTASYIGA